MNIIKMSWNLCTLFGILAIVLFICTSIDSRYEDTIAWIGLVSLILAIISGIPWMIDEWASRKVKT